MLVEKKIIVTHYHGMASSWPNKPFVSDLSSKDERALCWIAALYQTQ
jgi:hypothetical protein